MPGLVIEQQELVFVDLGLQELLVIDVSGNHVNFSQKSDRISIVTCPKDCSGHGSCLTMQELAEETKVNGESTLWTYGKVPNKKEVGSRSTPRYHLSNYFRHGIMIWFKVVIVTTDGKLMTVPRVS